MAKRFTDTGKWKDLWFQDLPSKYKLFWLYILDECDNAGIWKPNIKLASFQICEPFEDSELKIILAERITILDSGYWFIEKFIGFQYGELSETSKPHQSVLRILKNNKIKGYQKGIHTLKDKDKDKDKEKDKENEGLLEIGSEKIKEISNTVWRDQGWKESICMGLSVTMPELQKWLALFNSSISSEHIADFDLSSYKKMSRGWISKQKAKGVSVEGPIRQLSAAPLTKLSYD